MMPELILYLLKVNVALLLFYLGYHFILQQYTFHTVNRFYLLTGLIYSAIFPLIDLPAILDKNEQLTRQLDSMAPDWQTPVAVVLRQAEDTSSYYWQILLFIFWTGVIVMSVRLLIQLASLLIIHLKSRQLTLGEFKFRTISDAVNPFSFWRTIYINPDCHEAGELKSILAHEQVHVKQLHTADVLLAEISTIFYWFNPGVWLMKKAIKANLEYITDQEVIRSGIDRKEYQYTLLKTQVLPQNSMPVNNFHFLTIKKRIVMINKKPSHRFNLGKYLTLPLAMLILLVAGNSKATLSETKLVKSLENLTNAIDIPAPMTTAQSEAPKPSKSGIPDTIKPLLKKTVPRPDTNKLEIIQLKSSTQPNRIESLLGSLSKAGVSGKEPIYMLDGARPIKSAITISSDSIATINVYKVQGTATINNQEVTGYVFDIKTRTYERRAEPTEKRLATAYTPKYAEGTKRGSLPHALFIVDGKEIDKNLVENIKPADIESIHVLTGETATNRYGDKAKDGVLVIQMKKN
jgi:hypothetical protein